MNIWNTWIYNRRRKLVAIVIDFNIIFNLYSALYLKQFDSYPNKLVLIILSLFWVITSYILGRYMKDKEWNFATITNSVFKTFIILTICILIYLIINWGYYIFIFFAGDVSYFDISEKALSNFFIKTTCIMALVSLIVQNILSISVNNLYRNSHKWLFYGSEEKYKDVMDEISFSKRNIVLDKINDSNLERIIFADIEGLIVNDYNELSGRNLDIIFELKLKGLSVHNLLNWFEKEFHRIPTNIIDNKYQLIEKIKSLDDNYEIRIKRIGDITVSIFLLIISSPLFVLVGILIFIEDRGPIFYSQIRSGINGKEIKIIKFRSMRVDAERMGIQWSQNIDPRITKIGRLIRATRLDELPQLLCVIQGSMSLIGPRPERPEIEKSLLKDIPYYDCRNVVRPGISGWAQVNYPYGASVIDTKNKLSFDIYYISNFSILLDLLILFKTIKLVLNAKGSKPNISI